MKRIGIWIILLFTLTFPRIDFAQTATLNTQIIDLANSGDDKAVADIDGDEKADGILGGSSLVWYESGANYAKHVISAQADNEYTTDMTTGDVDGDGDPDIIFADGPNINNVRWYENPRINPPSGKTADSKNGANWTQHVIGSHGAFVHDISVGDLSGDGKLDVVTSGDSSGGPGVAHVWIQQTGGSSQDTNITQYSHRAVDIADFNGDGKKDIAVTSGWLQNNGNGTQWTFHQIAGTAGDGVVAGDLNGDGRPDMITMDAHNRSQVIIFYAPVDPTSSAWQQQSLDGNMGSHRARIVDFNHDGKNDVLLGLELQETSVYMNQGGGTFQKTQIDTSSGHNAAIGDINGDGKPDIFGADYIGHPPVKVYINTMAAGTPPTNTPSPGGGATTWDKWQYIQVTANHFLTFGLDVGDIDGDGKADIVSGLYWYKNPGGDLTGQWQQNTVSNTIEGALVYDVNGDGKNDIIGQQSANGVLSIYALINGNSGASWQTVHIGDLPDASHPQNGAQGYKLVKIRGGSKPEIVWTSGGGMWYFVIPANATQPNWEKVQVTPNTSDEGLGYGDIDGDGKIDLASTTGNSTNVEWYKNPGGTGGNWQVIHVGDMAGAVFPDRTEIADIDTDGKPDIVTTEENFGGTGAKSYWYKNPGGTSPNWTRTLLVNQGSTNSMHVADMNNDGKTDILLGEHYGTLKLSIYENKGGGVLAEHVMSTGKESHVGAFPYDLDGDGDLDIISIAYDANQFIHLWRNDNTIAGGGSCARKTLGDANCDGNITVSDFTIWKSEFLGKCSNTNLTTAACGTDIDNNGSIMDADNNGDGKVSVSDFTSWKTSFINKL